MITLFRFGHFRNRAKTFLYQSNSLPHEIACLCNVIHYKDYKMRLTPNESLAFAGGGTYTFSHVLHLSKMYNVIFAVPPLNIAVLFLKMAVQLLA